MKWKLDDSRPIWPQLKEHLLIAIIAGEYPMGESFPTVRELSAEAGVNRNTMQRALSELESDGLLVTNRTAGRTVTKDERLVTEMKEQVARNSIERFLEEMASIGYSAEDIITLIKEKGAQS